MSDIREKFDAFVDSILDAVEEKAGALNTQLREQRLTQLQEDLAELKKREDSTTNSN